MPVLVAVGQVNYPKVADSSSFDEDSSDALSPEQPGSHESQSSVPSPLEARTSEPLPSATSVSPVQVSLLRLPGFRPSWPRCCLAAGFWVAGERGQGPTPTAHTAWSPCSIPAQSLSPPRWGCLWWGCLGALALAGLLTALLSQVLSQLPVGQDSSELLFPPEQPPPLPPPLLPSSLPNGDAGPTAKPAPTLIKVWLLLRVALPLDLPGPQAAPGLGAPFPQSHQGDLQVQPGSGPPALGPLTLLLAP